MNNSTFPLPVGIGVGYKPQHFENILADPAPVSWLEIHAENYMGDGGPQIAQLKTLREVMPISCHGVGLSIGSEGPLDTEHLSRLKKLMGWLEPASFSEHLAWSTHDTHFLNDLLPVPYTKTVLQKVVEHVDQVQEAIGRQMLLENPSTYVAFAESTITETQFLREIAHRSGCGLLLDVNNVFVSAKNQWFSPKDYIESFPVEHVAEIHLGGHDDDTDETGAPLLIDSHNRPVTDPVWDLYAQVLTQTGAKPTLIEWDNNVPDWHTLRNEAVRAASILQPVRELVS